ncbi:hypothetical protein IFR05_002259 [Cadophora sp. M221]|nr:hypothetical protein IFR05_002259 [Cadophora sp. M221]
MPHRVESPYWESPAAEVHSPNTNDLARTETLSPSSSMPELIDPSLRGERSPSHPPGIYHQLVAEPRNGMEWNLEDALIRLGESENYHVNEVEARTFAEWMLEDIDGIHPHVDASGDDADDERLTPPNQASGNSAPRPARHTIGTTLEDMRQYMTSHGISGDAENWHRLYWSTDYGIPAPGQGQSQPQPQRPSRPGLVRDMIYTAPEQEQMEDQTADAGSIDSRAFSEGFINGNGVFSTSSGPEVDSSTESSDEPTTPTSTNLAANDAQPSDDFSTIDLETKDRYISLCEEYGSILDPHCRALWWKMEAHAVSFGRNRYAFPRLGLLEEIEIDMLSKDLIRLSQAASGYHRFMQAHEEMLPYDAELDTSSQWRIDIDRLMDFCQLLESPPFVVLGEAWRDCIWTHIGVETRDLM